MIGYRGRKYVCCLCWGFFLLISLLVAVGIFIADMVNYQAEKERDIIVISVISVVIITIIALLCFACKRNRELNEYQQYQVADSVLIYGSGPAIARNRISDDINVEAKEDQKQLYESFTHQDNESTCCICLEEFVDQKAILLKCGHLFHSACIRDWAAKSDNCPICRDKQ